MANNVLLAGNVVLGDTANNGGLTFSGSVDLGGTTRTLTVNSPVILANSVFDGALTKAGSGQLTLSSVNTYTGPTTVNAGTLQVAGTTSFEYSAPISRAPSPSIAAARWPSPAATAWAAPRAAPAWC